MFGIFGKPAPKEDDSSKHLYMYISIIMASIIGLYILYRWNRFSEKSAIGAAMTTEMIIKNTDLSNKVAIVTGANDGLGKETARVLLKQGATVIMAGHDNEKSEKARQDILTNLCSGTNNYDRNSLDRRLIYLYCEMGSLKSIRDFVNSFKKLNLPLHYLFNNAGILGLPNYELSKDGFEMQFAVNYLGHYYLTRLLTDKLLQSTPSRVITLGSICHNVAPEPFFEWINKHHKLGQGPLKEEYGSQGFSDYGVSKAAEILFAREYDRRYHNKGITSVSLHPGDVDTNLWRYNWPASIFRYVVIKTMKFFPTDIKTISKGAATQVRCVVMTDNEIKGGAYYRDCVEANDHLRWDMRPNCVENDDKETKLWDLSELLIRKAGVDFGDMEQKIE